jgi:hypothetical protein
MKKDNVIPLVSQQRRDAFYNELLVLRRKYEDLTNHEISHMLRLCSHFIDPPKWNRR